MEMNEKDILNLVQMECSNKGHSLLYLTKFGSKLYGTDNEFSDSDYKGIFLPNKKNMLLNIKCNHIQFKNDINEKNTKDDVDIELWSVQYWLLTLLRKGETESLDLLYSNSNRPAVLYESRQIKEIFNHKDKYIDSDKLQNYPYVKYCIAQASRFGIKGNRLNAIRFIKDWCEKNCPSDIEYNKNIPKNERVKLNQHADNILTNIPSDLSKHIYKDKSNKEECISICGKMHSYSIDMSEFYSRILTEYLKYGNRSKNAADNGIDWKALSHSVRGIHQVKELMQTGKICFPLKSSDYLRKIKEGLIPFSEISKIIDQGLDELSNLSENIKLTSKYDVKLIERLILKQYDE